VYDEVVRLQGILSAEKWELANGRAHDGEVLSMITVLQDLRIRTEK